MSFTKHTCTSVGWHILRYSQYSTAAARYDTDIMIALLFTISENDVFLHPDNKIYRQGHLCSIEVLHFKPAIL